MNLKHDNRVEVVREIEKQSFTPKEKIENVEEIRWKCLERMNDQGSGGKWNILEIKKIAQKYPHNFFQFR